MVRSHGQGFVWDMHGFVDNGFTFWPKKGGRADTANSEGRFAGRNDRLGNWGTLRGVRFDLSGGIPGPASPVYSPLGSARRSRWQRGIK